MILYFRTILEDIGIPQHNATVMYKDNRGALHMASAQQLSNRTLHIDITAFKFTDWVEHDLITLHSILTPDNCADNMTKAVLKITLLSTYSYAHGKEITTTCHKAKHT
jgi:hypothetical protein